MEGIAPVVTGNSVVLGRIGEGAAGVGVSKRKTPK